MSTEFDITDTRAEFTLPPLLDAIDRASDQDQVTWLTVTGSESKPRRIAAIVPVDVAEAHEEALEDLLSTPVASSPEPELEPRGVHLRIVQGRELIADLPGWTAGVPRVGEYLFHPNQMAEGQDNPHGIAGCVKVVTWQTHIRTEHGFVQNPAPYVEISI